MKKQDDKKRTWKDPSTPVRKGPSASCKCSLESCYLANSNVKKVLLHRRFWMREVKRSNKILPQILSPSQRKVRCNSAFSQAVPPLTTTPAFFFFPLNVILSLILQTLGADVWKVPMLFLSHNWWVCSSLWLRTTLKAWIHQAQRNWRLPRELLTAQCRATHEDTVNSLPWLQHKNFLVQRDHNKEGSSKNVWKN